MSINHIATEALRRMEGKDGLILQGCGGDLQEWLDGINEMFTEAGILKNGAKFQDISAFEYDGLTCLLYPFEGVDLEHRCLTSRKALTSRCYDYIVFFCKFSGRIINAGLCDGLFRRDHKAIPRLTG